MLEAFILGASGGAIAWFVFQIADAGAGGWGGYHHNEKWAVNPRVMRWLIPLIGVGIAAYLGYLKLLGLI